jgi:hypothetical protein
MSDDTRPEDHSNIPILTLPEGGFQSRIPAPFLEGKSDEEKFVYNEISKMAAFAEFAATSLVTLNQQLRHTNGKVKLLWALKELLTGYKGLVVALFAIIGAVSGVVAIVQFVMERWPK